MNNWRKVNNFCIQWMQYRVTKFISGGKDVFMVFHDKSKRFNNSSEIIARCDCPIKAKEKATEHANVNYAFELKPDVPCVPRETIEKTQQREMEAMRRLLIDD